MSLWSKRFINESEGGAPEISTYGVAVRHFRTHSLDTLLPYIRSGVHPASFIDAGILGTNAKGIGGVPPIVPRQFFYRGELPLKQQPTIDKPFPWS